MITIGDLNAVQARVQGWQGGRDVKVATQGGVRFEVFSIPLLGGTFPGGPMDGVAAILQAEVTCDFAVVFADEPFMKVSLSLADGESWGGSDYMYATACVVNWRRVKERQLFVGAKVALGVYDYPVRDVGDGMEMMVRFSFSGPAAASPIGSVDEYENSTSGPSWEAAEWLEG